MIDPLTGGIKSISPGRQNNSYIDNILASTQKSEKVNKSNKEGSATSSSVGPIVSSVGKDWPAPVRSLLSLEERYQRCLSVGYECVTENELKTLLENKDHPLCYDGFEPSGRMHIAQGVLKAMNVNRLTSSGCVFIFWVADWFALLNNKMDGDLDKIKKVGEYFIEVWKAVGMDMSNVR
eukprot:GHVR01088406.1.p1 GENE.GHVR01088406.1~~GHVR01088406.1.p1  ORF type:complete len:179 (-),score=34.58 GHVR01088406.1:105-641(-)